MKIMILLPVLSFLFGCSSTEISHRYSYKIKNPITIEDWEKNYKLTKEQRLSKCLSNFEKNVKIIKTPEIIRILETEPVIFVCTSHSQHINIVLDDGRCFRGVYIFNEAPEKYRKALQWNNILNLSEYIKNERHGTWETLAE